MKKSKLLCAAILSMSLMAAPSLAHAEDAIQLAVESEDLEKGQVYLNPYQIDGSYKAAYGQGDSLGITMMGIPYEQGITRTDSYWTFDTFYNLNKSYNSVQFQVGHVDQKDTGNGSIIITCDGEPVGDPIKLTGGMITKTITLNTENIGQLGFKMRGGGIYAVANIIGSDKHAETAIEIN